MPIGDPRDGFYYTHVDTYNLNPVEVNSQGYGRFQDGNYMSEGLSETLNGLPSILSYLVP